MALVKTTRIQNKNEYSFEGWWMVPRKLWVLENFSPISESRQCFYRVSEAHFFLVWFRNRLSLWLGFSNKGLSKSQILPFASPHLILCSIPTETVSTISQQNWVCCNYSRSNYLDVTFFLLFHFHQLSLKTFYMFPALFLSSDGREIRIEVSGLHLRIQNWMHSVKRRTYLSIVFWRAAFFSFSELTARTRASNDFDVFTSLRVSSTTSWRNFLGGNQRMLISVVLQEL